MSVDEIGVRGRMRRNEPMSAHTVWGVGGRASRVYRPADLPDLSVFIGTLPEDEPLCWIGLGSNLLVRDGGIPGTVILTSGSLGGMTLTGPRSVRAEAGVPCAKLARFCARHGLRGAEFMAGIPGTVGGALAMNAGAYGGETWRMVARVETIDRDGRIRARAREEFTIAYRQVRGCDGDWFASGEFALEPGSSEESMAEIRELLKRRALSQPTGQRSCGSVFRNPPGDFAGRLIEASGLKGTRIGGAVVSEKHANFIINSGEATAADIESLIEHVREAVRMAQGVVLDAEVRIVGMAGSEPQ